MLFIKRDMIPTPFAVQAIYEIRVLSICSTKLPAQWPSNVLYIRVRVPSLSSVDSGSLYSSHQLATLPATKVWSITRFLIRHFAQGLIRVHCTHSHLAL